MAHLFFVSFAFNRQTSNSTSNNTSLNNIQHQSVNISHKSLTRICYNVYDTNDRDPGNVKQAQVIFTRCFYLFYEFRGIKLKCELFQHNDHRVKWGLCVITPMGRWIWNISFSFFLLFPSLFLFFTITWQRNDATFGQRFLHLEKETVDRTVNSSNRENSVLSFGGYK